jgi:hypothetical protein
MGDTIVAAVADNATVSAPVGTWPGIVNDPSEPSEVPRGAEEKWQAIYERCGGNIGLLIQCVAAAREEGNWDDALDSVVTGPQLTVKNAFTPAAKAVRDGEAPLWTGKQWELVLQELVKARYHAVLQEDLENKLEDLEPGAKGGKKVLLSMVKYNLLALRPYSTLARDLPREVYGEDQEMVVTLPLPVHVWAAKRMLKKALNPIPS